MEKARVQLIKKDNFYYVLTYENSKNPKYKTAFPYHNKSQQQALEAARSFGEKVAKNLGVNLEENLNNVN